MRVAKVDGNNCVIPEINVGQKVRTEALMSATVVMTQKLKGSMTFTYLGGVKKEDFTLNLPVSAFIGIVPITKDQFAAILTGKYTHF